MVKPDLQDDGVGHMARGENKLQNNVPSSGDE